LADGLEHLALGKRNEGRRFGFLNQLVIIKASGKQTGNAFSLVRWLQRLSAAEPPYHVHG
jgi:hypothetical protein